MLLQALASVEQRLTAVSGGFCAGVVDPDTVNVRQLPSLALQNSFAVGSAVLEVVLSPDERLVAVVTADSRVHVFRVDQNERQFHWSLDCGLSGVSTVRFTQNSRFLLVASEFQTGLDFWSLKSRTVAFHSRLAKFSLAQPTLLALASASSGLVAVVSSQSSDGESPLALPERLSLLHVERDTLSAVAEFPLATSDAMAVHFGASDVPSTLLVLDSPLYARALLYSLRGERLGEFSLANRLGFKSVAIAIAHAAAVTVLLGGYDGKLRFCDGRNLALLRETSGTENFVTSETPVLLFREGLEFLASDHIRQQLHLLGHGENGDLQVTYERSEIACGQAFSLPSTKHVTEYRAGEKPRAGVAQLAISTRQFVAVRADEYANSVKIYDLTSFRLHAVLLHRAPVRDLAWAADGKLAIATGEARVFVVDFEAGETVGIFPVQFPATQLSWGDRNCLVVGSRDALTALREVLVLPKGG